MRLRTILATLFAVLVILLLSSASHAAPPSDWARTLVQDFPRRFDANRLNLFVSNTGWFGFDAANGGPGLYYPKGSNTTLLFAGGLWVGLDVSPPRVAIAEYSSEYAPGVVFPSGLPEGDAPDLIVYKMSPWTGNPDDTAYVERTPAELAADPTLDPVLHHAWSHYVNRAAPRGAPTRLYRLPITATADSTDSVDVQGPDVIGDQMLWCVYNDADPASHTNGAGSTAPVGVEVQQTVFGFNRAGPLGDVVFIKYRIINRSGATLTGLIPGLWTDPDVGGFADDLIATDVSRSMGYAYNGTNNDALYGASPPAIGVRMLDQPLVSSIAYISGTDPQDAGEVMNHLRGFNANGSIIVNPITNDPTHFMFSGDPVTGSGWLDTSPADRRQLVSSDAVTLAPGEVLDLQVAVVVGRGNNRLSSILGMQCNAAFAEAFHASGFTEAPSIVCPDEMCPRPLSFWEEQCVSNGDGMEFGAFSIVAQGVDGRSDYFDYGFTPSGLCAFVQDPGNDLRTEAERQFAIFLANVTASENAFHDAIGRPIVMSPLTAVNCPGIEAETVADLARRGTQTMALAAVTYEDLDPNPQALVGVNFGLPFFDGGASVAADFIGSTLLPEVQPDSFSTVEVRFGVSQMAYRYLRYEHTNGVRQGFFYGGFHPVPFQVWDLDRNMQLEAGFFERVLTDEGGTILPPEMQPATFDSTWGPDASDLGGREYLVIFRPAYTGLANPAFETIDINLNTGTLPAMYNLIPKLITPGALIDTGDLIRFQWGDAVIGSIDQMMLDLANQPPSDPAVQEAYANIAFCLEELNSRCDTPTPVMASLVQASANPDAVDLAWYAPGIPSASIERNHGGAGWSEVARVTSARDRIEWTDRDVEPGERYGYRLVSDGQVYNETWVDVPSTHRLSLAGTWPNPADREVRVVLSLARRSPARLEVMDVAGRRVAQRDVGQLGPGRHVIRMEELDRLPAGIYLLRITQDGATAFGRMVRVR